MAEVAAGFVLTDTSASTSQGSFSVRGGPTWTARAGFFAPVGENRQAGGAFLLDGRGHRSLLGEFRFQQDFAQPGVTTRLGLGILADVAPTFAIGPRISFGGGYEVRPGLRLGLDLAAGGTAVHLRPIFEVAAAAAWLF